MLSRYIQDISHVLSYYTQRHHIMFCLATYRRHHMFCIATYRRHHIMFCLAICRRHHITFCLATYRRHHIIFCLATYLLFYKTTFSSVLTPSFAVTIICINNTSPLLYTQHEHKKNKLMSLMIKTKTPLFPKTNAGHIIMYRIIISMTQIFKSYQRAICNPYWRGKLLEKEQDDDNIETVDNIKRWTELILAGCTVKMITQRNRKPS